MPKTKLFKYLALMGILTIQGCGKNPFKSYDESDAATDATIELENGNPQKAIDILLADLGDDFKDIYDSINGDTVQTEAINSLSTEIIALVDGGKSETPNLASILVTAKAHLHGIDPFKIALKYADNASNPDTAETNDASEEEENELTLLFPVLPEASLENIQGLDKAITVLSSIGSYKETSEEYKQALLLTASIALTTKALDANGDGKISPLEAITLSDDIAGTLLNQIANAAISAATSAADAGDEDSSVSAEQIQQIQSQIDAQEGATEEEKLKNFLANAQASE